MLSTSSKSSSFQQYRQVFCEWFGAAAFCWCRRRAAGKHKMCALTSCSATFACLDSDTIINAAAAAHAWPADAAVTSCSSTSTQPASTACRTTGESSNIKMLKQLVVSMAPSRCYARALLSNATLQRHGTGIKKSTCINSRGDTARTCVLPSSCVDMRAASSLVAPSLTGSGVLLLLMSAASLGTACAK